jgi:hypothetical protein
MNDAVGGGEMFKVEYSARTDNFKFMCTRAFSLNFHGVHGSSSCGVNAQPDICFPHASIAPVLGFGIAQYNSVADGTSTSVYRNSVKSAFRKNFSSSGGDAIIVNVELMDLNVSSMECLNGSFAILGKSGDGVAVVEHDHDQFCQYFSPPIGRISKLKLALTDMDGRPYDTQNQDHRFEFLVDTSSRQRN